MTHELWILVFCTCGLLALLGAPSGIVNQLLWVSEPLACMLAGIALATNLGLSDGAECNTSSSFKVKGAPA